MEVEAHKFDSPSSVILRQIIVIPKCGKAPDEQVIETEMEKLGKVLDVYEERLSKSKYLAGENYSLADLHHIPHLVYFMKIARPVPSLLVPMLVLGGMTFPRGLPLLKFQQPCPF